MGKKSALGMEEATGSQYGPIREVANKIAASTKVLISL
jgi:hypothetical protein